MEAPTWVLDTNVIVSGLLVAAGFSGRLLDAVLTGRLSLAYDDRIEVPACCFATQCFQFAFAFLLH